MRKLVALAFLAVIVSSALLPEVKQQAMNTFAQLKSLKIGSSIMSAIQVELQTNNKDQVDDILSLLNDLITDSNSQLSSAQTGLENETQTCSDVRADLTNQIQDKQDAIEQAQGELPGLQQSHDDAVHQAEVDVQTQEWATQQISDANEANDLAVAAFNKSIRNHQAFIDALAAARALIAQLASNSFLQKNDKVLIQLQQHKENAKVLLQNHKSASLFNILMQMAQDVGIQADQELVNNILTIIDDLSAHEVESVSVESSAEEQRVGEYNAQIESLNGQYNAAHEDQQVQEANAADLQSQIDNHNRDIANWGVEKSNLEVSLDNHNDVCNSTIHSFEVQISNLHDQINAVQAAIDIFEGHSIQEIRSVIEF